MPPRPSRNLDRALVAAGQALYPATGCGGLTIRQVADAAGVNIGMFHYHFKTRDAFLRAVMQATYEDMYSRLPVPAAQPRETSPLGLLRMGLKTLGRFAREHRQFLARLLSDAMSGEPVARAFVAENFPRHLQLMGSLIAAGQQAGELRALAIPQAIAFCAGSISIPVLVAGAVLDAGEISKARARALEHDVLSERALDERIELALVALAAPAPRLRAPSAPTQKRFRRARS